MGLGEFRITVERSQYHCMTEADETPRSISMNTPKKVIEKISLPLMFVTFVMAVLMFAVSPVSAAPGCRDADGDGYYKFHHKNCLDGDDTDDSDPCWPDPGAEACHVVINDGDIYTAELIIAHEYLDGPKAWASSGAFRFAEGNGPDFEKIIPPIEVITGRSTKDLGLGPLPSNGDDVEMWRPNCGGWEPDTDDPSLQPNYPTKKSPGGADIDGPGPWPNIDIPNCVQADGDLCYKNCTYVEESPGVPGTDWIPDWYLVETWDRMFAIGCPELLGTSEDYKIERILSTYGDWDFSEPGNYRLILRDIRLQDWKGINWDVTMQLIAHDVHPWIRGTGDWLPDDGATHLFYLTKGNMWGREVGGGPGGRQSCHHADDGTEERIDGFFLYDPLTCLGNQACKDKATSVMEIVNPADE